MGANSEELEMFPWSRQDPLCPVWLTGIITIQRCGGTELRQWVTEMAGQPVGNVTTQVTVAPTVLLVLCSHCWQLPRQREQTVLSNWSRRPDIYLWWPQLTVVMSWVSPSDGDQSPVSHPTSCPVHPTDTLHLHQTTHNAGLTSWSVQRNPHGQIV